MRLRVRKERAEKADVGPDNDVMPAIPDYTSVKWIGRGGFGTVWMVRNHVGKARALKVVWASRRDGRYAFKREFDALKRYELVSEGHEGLLKVLHIGKRRGFFYYTMPLADSTDGPSGSPDNRYVPKTLAAVLKGRKSLPRLEAINIILPVLDALSYLHQQGLIHRDIKPDCILFRNKKPILGDISLVTEPKTLMTIVGTAGYMPLGGYQKPTDDLYAVGKMLYVMVSGCCPEAFPNVPSKIDDGDVVRFCDLNAVMNKACSLEYLSAEDMANDLRSILPNVVHPAAASTSYPVSKATESTGGEDELMDEAEFDAKEDDSDTPATHSVWTWMRDYQRRQHEALLNTGERILAGTIAAARFAKRAIRALRKSLPR